MPWQAPGANTVPARGSQHRRTLTVLLSEMNTYIRQIDLTEHKIRHKCNGNEWKMNSYSRYVWMPCYRNLCPKIASVTLKPRLVRETACHPFGAGRPSNQQWSSMVWFRQRLIHSPTKGPVKRKAFPCDDVIIDCMYDAYLWDHGP